MPVLEQQPIDAFIGQAIGHGLSNGGMSIFMHDFIALNVNAPISILRNCSKCFVGFEGQYATALAQGVIPSGLNNGQVAFQLANQFHRGIVRFSNGYDHFIAQGLDGLDGLCNRIIICNRISNERESNDFHGGSGP